MRRFLFVVAAVIFALTCAAQDAARESVSIEDAIFFVKTDTGKGVAFLMENPTGGVWMVSNSSNFQDSKTYQIVNAAGDQVSFPDQVFVAEDRDLIRFKTDCPAGLRRADACGFDEALLAFSYCNNKDENEAIKAFNKSLEELREARENIEDVKSKIDNPKYIVRYTEEELDEYLENVDESIEEVESEIAACKETVEDRNTAKKIGEKLTKGFLLNGQAVAVGPDRIEVSSPINRFDRGGPVLNKERELVGIASHMMQGSGLPDWVTEGTRFEETRCFALKLDGVKWIPMARNEYQKELACVQENFDALSAFASVIDGLSEGYMQHVSVQTDNRDIQRWVETHNQLSYKDSDREIEQDKKAFLRMVRRLEYDAGKLSDVSIPYHQQQLADLAEMYGAIRERTKKIMASD
jgi:hypothetical protein